MQLNSQNLVKGFYEKQQGNDKYVNGGFFVLSPKVIDFIQGDHISWEQEPLQKLVNLGNLKAFLHNGFWHCMDTLRDKKYLENLYNSNEAKWTVWK